MAFTPQTFTLGEVLTAAKMNQMDANIDEVRRHHKGSSAPTNLDDAIFWIDDTANPWVLKVYDGTNWIEFYEFNTSTNLALPSQLITEADTIDSNDNDTTIPSSAAVKDHVEKRFVRETRQTTTSGTQKDFTGIPSWVKRITVVLDSVSLSGTDNLLVQIGDAGGIETTGYSSYGVRLNTTGNNAVSSTSGFIIRTGIAGIETNVIMRIVEIDANDWISENNGASATTIAHIGGGRKTLSDTLTQVRLTATGSNTFDNGQVNIMYE